MLGFGRALTSTIMSVLAIVFAIFTFILCYGFNHIDDTIQESDLQNGNFGYKIQTSEAVSENQVKQAVSDAIVAKCGIELTFYVGEDGAEHEGYKIYNVTVTYPSDEQKKNEIKSKNSEIAAQIANNLNIGTENVKSIGSSTEAAFAIAFAMAFGYGLAYAVILIFIIVLGLHALIFSIVGLVLGIKGIKCALAAKAEGVLPTAPFVLSIIGTSLSGASMLLLAIGIILVILA